MQKKPLVLFSFLIGMIITLGSYQVSAQSFQNICPPGITFFSGYNRSVMAFRHDSTIVLPTGDSIFYSYPVIRDTSNGGCKDVSHGSLLGRKVHRTVSGWFYFFNRYGDTIRINPGANVTETWNFCNLPGGNYLEARVNQLLFDSVLGMVDQIKIIALQAKNAAGINVSHKFNQTCFKLSKHAGLTQFFDVYYIPGDTAKKFLSGRSEPAMKLQNLTLRNVYDLDTGDVIHLEGSAPGGGWKLIKKVIGVTKWDNDSVMIRWERCEKRLSFSTYTSYHDTVNEKVIFTSANSLVNHLERLPGEWTPGNGYANRYYFYENTFHHRDMKGIGYNAYHYEPPYYPCWLFYGWVSQYNQDEYTAGLTRTKHTYQYFPGNVYSSESMVYYRKGSEWFGTPLSDDCTALVGVEPLPENTGLAVTTGPVPVESTTTITLSGTEAKQVRYLKVFNILGREVASQEVSDNVFVLDRSGLPGGIYVLAFVSFDGKMLLCRKITLL